MNSLSSPAQAVDCLEPNSLDSALSGTSKRTSTAKRASSKECKTVAWIPPIYFPELSNLSTEALHGYIEEWLTSLPRASPSAPLHRRKAVGGADERDKWPETRDVIRIIRPRFTLLENVPGIVTSGYAATVLSDLAALGYVGRAGMFRASDFADHKRERWFCLAYSVREGLEECETIRKIVGEKIGGLPWLDSGRHVFSSHWPEIAGMPCGEPDEASERMAAIQAGGNGQVPAVVVRAWQELTG